ncbi:hypothetical protein PCC7424_3960 [Gloeothece citriformis PCC 7424]|uniref:Uncharacterized protein n=1 Tax=Gloeothece citriformis (strain PCC 7424) TaxID=65393 RepID=B7KKK1_GLOC7|nr:hypothetical protein [Gloeothece citriformis]ACK72334.1 hypothetical protein PCC7424_3960 [Gloeothece citriformis PCC 7424]
MVDRKPTRKPLGEILRQANLVSPTQLEEALLEQSRTKGRIGEILVKRGCIKQETADFFAQDWIHLVTQKEKQPLGHYLKQAGLLDDEQINTIIGEQNEGKLWIRLGALAALKGWVKQSTIDFFVEHLYPEQASESPFTKPKSSRKKSKGLGLKGIWIPLLKNSQDQGT